MDYKKHNMKTKNGIILGKNTGKLAGGAKLLDGTYITVGDWITCQIQATPMGIDTNLGIEVGEKYRIKALWEEDEIAWVELLGVDGAFWLSNFDDLENPVVELVYNIQAKRGTNIKGGGKTYNGLVNQFLEALYDLKVKYKLLKGYDKVGYEYFGQQVIEDGIVWDGYMPIFDGKYEPKDLKDQISVSETYTKNQFVKEYEENMGEYDEEYEQNSVAFDDSYRHSVLVDVTDIKNPIVINPKKDKVFSKYSKNEDYFTDYCFTWKAINELANTMLERNIIFLHGDGTEQFYFPLPTKETTLKKPNKAKNGANIGKSSNLLNDWLGYVDVLYKDADDGGDNSDEVFTKQFDELVNRTCQHYGVNLKKAEEGTNSTDAEAWEYISEVSGAILGGSDLSMGNINTTKKQIKGFIKDLDNGILIEQLEEYDYEEDEINEFKNRNKAKDGANIMANKKFGSFSKDGMSYKMELWVASYPNRLLTTRYFHTKSAIESYRQGIYDDGVTQKVTKTIGEKPYRLDIVGEDIISTKFFKTKYQAENYHADIDDDGVYTIITRLPQTSNEAKELYNVELQYFGVDEEGEEYLKKHKITMGEHREKRNEKEWKRGYVAFTGTKGDLLEMLEDWYEHDNLTEYNKIRGEKASFVKVSNNGTKAKNGANIERDIQNEMANREHRKYAKKRDIVNEMESREFNKPRKKERDVVNEMELSEFNKPKKKTTKEIEEDDAYWGKFNKAYEQKTTSFKYEIGGL